MPVTRSQTALKVSEREAAGALLQLRKAVMKPIPAETVIERLERILARAAPKAQPAPTPKAQQKRPQRAAARLAGQRIRSILEEESCDA